MESFTTFVRLGLECETDFLGCAKFLGCATTFQKLSCLGCAKNQGVEKWIP